MQRRRMLRYTCIHSGLAAQGGSIIRAGLEAVGVVHEHNFGW